MERINKIVIDSTESITELCELATEFPTDKSPYCYAPGKNLHRHPYTAVYDLLFGFRRLDAVSLGELGILDNMSMRAWRSYFPNATLYGFDAFSERLKLAEKDLLPNVYYRHADVKDRNSMFDAFNGAQKKFDILIDDSTHLFPDQIEFVTVAMQFMNPGGLIIVEDVFRGWDEAKYTDALEPYYPYFLSGTFIDCRHSNSYSAGSIEPYFNNDKLLVLARNSAPVPVRRPDSKVNRKLLDEALNSERFRRRARSTQGADNNPQSNLSELGIIKEVATIGPVEYQTSSSGVKIYVVNHLADRIPPDIPGFTNLLVGQAAAGLSSGSATDKLRNGDSLLNRRWSELSAIYKVWQEGPRSEVVGFCHYRRYLSFSQEMSAQSKYTVSGSQLAALTKNELSRLEELSELDARAFYVARATELPQTVFETYSSWHSRSDYLEAFKIAAMAFPDLGAVMAEQFQQIELYAGNLFVMNWADFDELCHRWFTILGEFVRCVEWPRGSVYQNRDVSFLSERIFDAWVRLKEHSGYQVIKVPTIFVA